MLVATPPVPAKTLNLNFVVDLVPMFWMPEETVRERLKSGQPTWINPTTVRGKRVWYTASIGREPHLPEVIMERVRESVR
jgi:hypothetical protein